MFETIQSVPCNVPYRIFTVKDLRVRYTVQAVLNKIGNRSKGHARSICLTFPYLQELHVYC